MNRIAALLCVSGFCLGSTTTQRIRDDRPTILVDRDARSRCIANADKADELTPFVVVKGAVPAGFACIQDLILSADRPASMSVFENTLRNIDRPRCAAGFAVKSASYADGATGVVDATGCFYAAVDALLPLEELSTGGPSPR